MAKKKPTKKTSKKKVSQPVVPKHLFVPIVASIILSIGAIAVSFYSLSDAGDSLWGDIEADEEMEVVAEVEETTGYETLDLELVQRILDGTPKPYFVQDEYHSFIEVTNPITGEHARVTSTNGIGLRLFAVPDDYDGRIFAVYSGETEHAFKPVMIDLNDLSDLEPVFVKDPGFNKLEMLNILSPTQRYVASLSDEYMSRDHRRFLVLSDLLGERHESTIIRDFDERITSTDGDPDGLPDLLPEFEIAWVSDECVEFTVYDNSTPEPRAALRTEEVCVFDGLGL